MSLYGQDAMFMSSSNLWPYQMITNIIYLIGNLHSEVKSEQRNNKILYHWYKDDINSYFPFQLPLRTFLLKVVFEASSLLSPFSTVGEVLILFS